MTHPKSITVRLSAKLSDELETVRFGSVEVRGAALSRSEKRRNVATGQAALSRATSKIVKPGFARSLTDSAPRYRADPNNPDILIRELNGVQAKGTFVNGKFRASRK